MWKLLDAESLTRQIDAAVDMIGPDESNILASAAGRIVLAELDEDDW